MTNGIIAHSRDYSAAVALHSTGDRSEDEKIQLYYDAVAAEIENSWKKRHQAVEEVQAIMHSIIARYGLTTFCSWWKHHRSAMWLAIRQAFYDRVLFDDKGAHLFVVKSRDKENLIYTLSYRTLLTRWRTAHPGCNLEARCWSTKEYESWLKTSVHKGYPDHSDAVQWADSDQALEMVNHAPGRSDWVLAFVQVIKTCGTDDCTNYSTTNYKAAELNAIRERSNSQAWSTHPGEMYKKIAIKRFIKWDLDKV